jgi:hypothetical protein
LTLWFDQWRQNMNKVTFPDRPSINPRIYAYEDTNAQYVGLLKIGYTTRSVNERVAEQYPTRRPGPLPYRIVLDESAMKSDGSIFTDREVHRYLKKRGFLNPDGEWFRCDVKDVSSAILTLSTNKIGIDGRTQNFKMRPEQVSAVQKTRSYYESYRELDEDKIPHFLWNAKMRFGKTFASYQLARELGWKRVLVLTFKPAVQSAWEEDLASHVDFTDWQFVSRGGLDFTEIDETKPVICFGSFQDYLGKNKAGGLKPKNEWVHTINWDCVIFDEYHYGAWRENAKELFEAEESKEIRLAVGEGIEYFDEEIMPITTNSYLYLSGTPFRAIESGEFIEEQIFNWTYSDEQTAKTNWEGANNPYSSLPRMVLMTYQLPDDIRQIAMAGEFDEFDLNVFFSATGEKENSTFVYESEVQKWLDLIRGSHLDTTKSNLHLGRKRPPMPFSDSRLLRVLNHTFWFLPSVSSCYAMKKLISEKQNTFYHEHDVVVAAGSAAGMGVEALLPVQRAMDNPLETKTITLSCGKLTTGVSVKPWTGIFMLRNSSSPETYFQAAFRVQTPWVARNLDGKTPNHEEIIKEQCYVFDFAPDRALRQIAEYSCRLNVAETNPEAKVQEFINFLPVLAYDGSTMKQINAGDILDIAMSGTSATLLARRWSSALLVNVDNATLSRLMDNDNAMNALMSIEGFRSLSQDIQTIINKSESIKKAKGKANEDDLTKKEKKQLSDDEKEYKSKRKLIQEKLIKFATRIPIFMYLTDYREHCLKDVITQLEPGLFKKVTGLTVEDFDLLVSLNVFNSSLMNDAVYKFKRYEDASLSYAGIDKTLDNYGLFDTVIDSNDVYELN